MPRPPRTSPRLQQGAAAVLIAVAVAALVVFLWHAWLCLSFPFPIDYGEAPLLDQALRLSRGEGIYPADLSEPPYTITNYPPLYVVVMVPLLWVLGPGFAIGRLLAVLGAVASACFVGATVYHFGRDRLAAVSSGALLLAFPGLVHWSGLLRIDFLALALSTGGLCVLARRSGSVGSVRLGALLLVGAIFTRQSYALAAPLAAVIWLWPQSRRRALELAGIVAGGSLLLYGALMAVTGGGFFFHTVTANVNEFLPSRLAVYLRQFALQAPLFLLLGAALLVAGRRRWSGWGLMAPYLVGAFLSALTVGKIGSNVNYFLELSVAVCLATGAALASARSVPWLRWGLVVAVALQGAALVRLTWNDTVPLIQARRADGAAIEQLGQLVAETDGAVLADEYMGLLTGQGRPLQVQPFEMTQLARAGLWDPAGLEEQVRRRDFPLVLVHYLPGSLLHQERWPAAVLRALQQSYHPAGMLAGTVVFRPSSSADSSRIPALRRETLPAIGLRTEDPIRITRAPFVLQPDIAIRADQPDHLASVAIMAQELDCDLAVCPLGLELATSVDGGTRWSSQPPFAPPAGTAVEGLVRFGPRGNLYVLGIRDGAVTVNRAGAETGYRMDPRRQVEVTRSQVGGKPWLQVHPSTGDLLVSYTGLIGDGSRLGVVVQTSRDGGSAWSAPAWVDPGIAVDDVFAARAMPTSDTRVLFGPDGRLTLVWTWTPFAWVPPYGIWMAHLDPGGRFSAPVRIGETWGPINVRSDRGAYYVLYRTGDERRQELALATSRDGGRTFDASLVSGELPLQFDQSRAPGIGVTGGGTVDVVFYAHAAGSAGCALDVQRSMEIVATGWTDPCEYDVYYTFSRDGGGTFHEPRKLNPQPIRGERFVRTNGASIAATHIALASSERFAYPVWIDTRGDSGTQAYTMRIER